MGGWAGGAGLGSDEVRGSRGAGQLDMELETPDMVRGGGVWVMLCYDLLCLMLCHVCVVV